ncbi:YgiW/YdeI family stress tolerance OB fold protein [Pseudorhodoplanes sp.]|uniref:YgiW/YdeI family stress tolerance OB fold protein n=1 Tax=Pseudorhodoplanes sp. TaxID=1934341 RepID=UPI003D121583
MTPVSAQFKGLSAQVRVMTVAEVQKAGLGRYVVVTGNIVSHQRGDYFTSRDKTGEIRVESEPNVWQGREIVPETTVHLLAEVDQERRDRYLWVKSLDIVQQRKPIVLR